jgi:hypothetical protein
MKLTARLRDLGLPQGDPDARDEDRLMWQAADTIDGLVALLRWARAGDDKEKNLHGYLWRDRVDGMLSELEPVSSPEQTTVTQNSKPVDS